ncbi:WD40/YVTN/BNR-like repeat-containing protein [Novosphingobium album (ex Liu et al. 2023)]|uniref:WD40/YVTN/BNR-like repeat-containing protein n=1 Tax=Novosphingobium album (ex Liu et al. 2023) TaxID=3031130 RepID=UPI0023B12577|nr:glycosyl hydrolase [Novosphingobium album (ex Liu et al. 2023)]
MAAAKDAAKPVDAAATTAESQALPLDGMQYRMIGPFRGGRASGVSGVTNDPTTYYMGAATGGVWKTTDAGRTWKPLWDKFPEASPSIGALAVAPSDSNIIYVGTGESAIRGNVAAGNGMYKSLDAGKTWQFIGLRQSEAIGRLAISATDPNTVFVAALGPVFREGGERGIFRTRDGGKTWERVLYVDDKTGGVDVQIDPNDPNLIYAAMWQAHRKPWIMESGGPGSGLYRSRDGGNTWEKLSGNGLPPGIWGRIGVAPTSDPKRIYALIEAEKGGLYRSDDAGASWQLMNSDGSIRQRAWYYTTVYADPKDPNKVFVMNVNGQKSTDGGKTFKTLPLFHGDTHQLWINPRDPRYIINANDGGAGISVNGGETWTEQMNQPTAQIYHISVDNQVPYNIYGAQQDNTTIRIPSANTEGPIGVQHWRSVGGGESGYVVPDPKDPNIVYAGSYWGDISRYDERTGEAVPVKPWPRESMGWGVESLKHRRGWTVPFAFSPHDPNVLYYANEVLFKTTNGGKSWDIISPDLTRNDKSKQIASGGPLTKDNTSVEVYGTIFSLNESPVEKGLIWVGTDDGLIQLTRDGGQNWSNITPAAMPEWGTVDMVEPHPHKAGTAYIAVERHKLGDNTPYAFRTDDYGKSWVSITKGLPADAYVHVVRADPERDGLLYAGTESGIFFSLDDGASWKPLKQNMPRVPVHDLVVHDGDIAVATHGRSFWVLDDVSPLRQWSDSITKADFHLFKPRQTVRIQYTGRGDMTGTFAGPNPPQGTIIYYSLKQEVPADRIKLEILDASGKVIRTYAAAKPKADSDGGEDEDGPRRPPAPGTKAGLNRFAWDMRYDGAVQVPKSALWHASTLGPVALPGKYTARLTVNGKVQTQPIEIVPYGKIPVSPDQLKKQFDLALAVNTQLNAVQMAVLEIRDFHAKLADVRKAAAGSANGAGVIAAADALEAKVNAVEEELIQKKSVSSQDPLNHPVRLNNMLASLSRTVTEGDVEPTTQLYVEFDELKAMATTHLGTWASLKTSDLAAFNALAAKAKLKPITLATPAMLAEGK